MGYYNTEFNNNKTWWKKIKHPLMKVDKDFQFLEVFNLE